MANQEPARTWPWSSARAVIVRPSSAAATGPGDGREQAEEDQDRPGEAQQLA